MRLSVAGLVILVGASLAAAQKDPMLVKPHPNQHPANSQRSLSPDAVAAVLNRKSTTAKDLAKIERGAVNPGNAAKPATTHTPAPKNFGLGQDNRNRPVNVSKPGAKGSFHPKKKTG